MKKPTLTQWIAAQLGRRELIICADLSDELTERMGYRPSEASVGRVLAGMGWKRVVRVGRVGYRKGKAK